MIISITILVHFLSELALATILAPVEEASWDVDLLLDQIVNALSTGSDEGPLHVLEAF